MWIKFKEPMTLRMSGTSKHFKIGDFAEIKNTKQALQWIASGRASEFTLDKIFDDDDIGIVSLYPPALPYPLAFQRVETLYPVFARTIVNNANTSFNKSPHNIRNVGRLAFMLTCLQRWDVVVTLQSLKARALEVATPEHEITKAIVGDLRVPFYDGRFFAVRDSAAGKKFCEIFNEEWQRGEKLALLRTVYRSKALVYYLLPN